MKLDLFDQIKEGYQSLVLRHCRYIPVEERPDTSVLEANSIRRILDDIGEPVAECDPKRTTNGIDHG